MDGEMDGSLDGWINEQLNWLRTILMGLGIYKYVNNIFYEGFIGVL